jgi:hypothetical protein
VYFHPWSLFEKTKLGGATMETLQRTPDGEGNLDNVADRAEAWAAGIEIVDVTGGISEAQEHANLFHEIPASGYTLPVIGRIALRRGMPPFDQWL